MNNNYRAELKVGNSEEVIVLEFYAETIDDAESYVNNYVTENFSNENSYGYNLGLITNE